MYGMARWVDKGHCCALPEVNTLLSAFLSVRIKTTRESESKTRKLNKATNEAAKVF